MCWLASTIDIPATEYVFVILPDCVPRGTVHHAIALDLLLKAVRGCQRARSALVSIHRRCTRLRKRLGRDEHILLIARVHIHIDVALQHRRNKVVRHVVRQILIGTGQRLLRRADCLAHCADDAVFAV